MPTSFNQTIDGVEYVRTIYNDRLETITPVAGWPDNTKNYNLRKNLIESGRPKICSECESEDENDLDAHHIEPVKYLKTPSGNPYQDPLGNHSASNGRWLCRSCHNKIHHS